VPGVTTELATAAPLAPAPAAFSVDELAAYGREPALLTRDDVLTYADLAGRVRATAKRLGAERRLVLIAGANTVESVVTYLAAITAGHVVLLAPSGDTLTVEAMVAAYDPDVVAGPGGRWEPQVRRQGSRHDLHPDLALLLSTSGSTGSPKLVRLSHDNLRSNAAAIADYLGIRGTDRAITSLPLHYCYGLSVLHSHLLRGAGIVLTDLSVADPAFWQLFTTHRATTFAGVPHTFELLERVGFADMDLPSLRYVTQAGGRLAPERVVRFAVLGRRRGWDLFVMYGQTEATARIAYLPPDLATSHPGSIGVPVPGGSLRIDPVPGLDEAGLGELVYTGRNVMLGYAEGPADLRRGPTVTELRTGDLAKPVANGMFEVVGRLNRFVKVSGLRVDLHQVEAALEGHATASCASIDDELVVVVEGRPDTERIRRRAAAAAGLPPCAVRVVTVDSLPRLASGKPDHRAVTELAGATARTAPPPESPGTADGSSPAALRAMYAEVLDRTHVGDDDTFVSLGGDSLSYVEVSLRLERALGHLPAGWHQMSVAELAAAGRVRPGRWRRIETGVALRAAAIVAVVASHVELIALVGGAHLLLGVAGYNLGRFHLTAAPRAERRRRLLTSTARVALPSIVWIAAVAWAFGDLGWANVALLHAVFGPEAWGPQWHYWFIETIVHTLLLLTAVLSIPMLDRAERRWPFWFALGVVGLGLLTRYDVVAFGGGEDRIHTGHIVFWLFALGWATAKAATNAQRWLLTALILATLPGFFGDPQRDAVVAGGLLLLLWVPKLPCPAALVRLVGVLASASLYIYLTHWQIYPHLEVDYPLAALLASLAVGIAYWLLCRRAATWLRPVLRLGQR